MGYVIAFILGMATVYFWPKIQERISAWLG